MRIRRLVGGKRVGLFFYFVVSGIEAFDDFVGYVEGRVEEEARAFEDNSVVAVFEAELLHIVANRVLKLSLKLIDLNFRSALKIGKI